MKIDFKSKKVKIIIGVIVLAIVLALILTTAIIKSYRSKQNNNAKVTAVDPTATDYEAKIKATDEKLTRVNEELGKVKIDAVTDNITKYNLFGMDEYFETMGVTKVEATIFNFVNEDIYLVKVTPIADSLPVQTFYYKDNEFTALDVESQGSGAITRYYIYKQKVIAEKALVSTDTEKNGTVKMYVAPLVFDGQEEMLAVATDNYNYSKDESIQTQGEALTLATKAMIGTDTKVSFEKMEMIANKEYYVFKEITTGKGILGFSNTTIWICIEKETGAAVYKDTSAASTTLIPKTVWIEKNEMITLKIYYSNSDATATVAKEYAVNKAAYNKDITGQLAKIMNTELGLGINTITITGGKAVVDISKNSSETKFDNGSAGAAMAIESLTKTIFANTTATTIKVTVAGEEKVVGNHFSFAEEFKK